MASPLSSGSSESCASSGGCTTLASTSVAADVCRLDDGLSVASTVAAVVTAGDAELGAVGVEWEWEFCAGDLEPEDGDVEGVECGPRSPERIPAGAEFLAGEGGECAVSSDSESIIPAVLFLCGVA